MDKLKQMAEVADQLGMTTVEVYSAVSVIADITLCPECNRRLRSAKSRLRGIGPVCAKKREKRLFAEAVAQLNPELYTGEQVPGGLQMAIRVPDGS